MNTSTRPILHIAKTTPEKIMNVIGYFTFIISTIYLLYKIPNMPSAIPIHYAFDGKVDGWGSPWSLISLPLIAFTLIIIFEIIERIPHRHNYLQTITEENARPLYTASRQLSNYLKNIMLIFFAYVNLLLIDFTSLFSSQSIMIPCYILLAAIFLLIIWKIKQMNTIQKMYN